MNIADNRRAFRHGATLLPTVAAVLYLTVATASTVLAAPLAFSDPGGGQPGRPDPHFAQRVEMAVDLIREQAPRVPACRAYFERLGVDLDAWLSPHQPPYVIPRKLGISRWRSTDPICGGAQSRPPFEFLFVDQACFRGRRLCGLASLLLHEMGHLARRDTRDNEPVEFFIVCRLSSCVDPARYR